MSLIKNLYNKYKVQSRYLIFGVATTAISTLSYYFLSEFCHLPNVPSVILSWFFAVLFAYTTNKLFVFESRSCGLSSVMKEAVSFFLCRASTGALEVFIMWLSVDVLKFQPMVMKITANIIVIVLNYIVSSFMIFRKKTDAKLQGGNYEQETSEHHSPVL